MKLSLIPTIATLFLTHYRAFSAAQQATILPTTLPACATSCTLLQQAQTGCVPPAAPVSSQATYQSCFCQSGYLTPLAQSSNDNICSPECSAQDMSTIQTWFKGLCGDAAAASPSSVSSTTLATSASLGAAPGAVTSAPASGIQVDNTGTTNKQTWMATHWRWVVMLIVLFVAFLVIGIVASWLHRRNRRKREAQGGASAAARPDLGTWAPPTRSVHDVGVPTEPRAAGAGAEKGKGKERERDPVAVKQESSGGSGGRRLKKGWIR